MCKIKNIYEAKEIPNATIELDSLPDDLKIFEINIFITEGVHKGVQYKFKVKFDDDNAYLG